MIVHVHTLRIDNHFQTTEMLVAYLRGFSTTGFSTDDGDAIAMNDVKNFAARVPHWQRCSLL